MSKPTGPDDYSNAPDSCTHIVTDGAQFDYAARIGTNPYEGVGYACLCGCGLRYVLPSGVFSVVSKRPENV